MNMERRFVPGARTEVRGDGEDRKIAGIAAVFYDGTPDTEFELWEGFRERIMPGAFDRAIEEDDVRGLFNHDANHLLGRTAAGTMRLEIREDGLHYEIDPPDTTTGRDVSASLERGDVTGSSFAFEVTDEMFHKEDGDRIREIRGVRLYDVGPVTYPAYTATTALTRDEMNARADDPLSVKEEAPEPVESAAPAQYARVARLREIEAQG